MIGLATSCASPRHKGGSFAAGHPEARPLRVCGWVSTDVIGWSSYTTILQERDTHETRFRLTSHNANLPWLRSEIRREDRTAEKQSEHSLSRLRKQYQYPRGPAAQWNRVRPEIAGRLRQNPEQLRKVNPAPQSAVRNPHGELNPDFSCGLAGSWVGLEFSRCAEHVKMLQPHSSGYAARLPVMHSLRSNIGTKTQKLRNLCSATKIINNLRICFHGYILNAVFRHCQTGCLT